jgi:5'-phosphate synthase pdxT subunit
MKAIRKVSGDSNRYVPVEVRTVADLDKCDAIILPGGESTAMRIIATGGADENGQDLFSVMKHRIRSGFPVFGTCAGCILMSDRVSSSLGGGDNASKPHIESLDAIAVYGEQHIGGLDANTCRNFFGRQTRSFRTNASSAYPDFDDFPCIFIRAPAIASVGSKAEVVATIKLDGEVIIVAARQGNILGTCFHPELSDDMRVHKLFLSMADEFARDKSESK